ncbi:MAG: hypothetical protein Q4C87_01580 [Actinomycetaceae bacterium]|nr:hypothetical protein [Actinomycetaceae bacterium]
MSRTGYTRLVALCAAATLALGACSTATGGGSSGYADPFYSPEPSAPGGTAGAAGADSLPQSVRARIDIRRGRGVVRIGHLNGTYVPRALIEAFEQASGYTVELSEVPRAVGSARAVDVLVGLDDSELAAGAVVVVPEVADAEHIPGTEVESVPGAYAYGRDDVCVLADRSWFSANNLKVPTSLAEISAGDYASQLVIPAPKNTVDGRAFAQLISLTAANNPRGWVTTATSAGATVDTGLPLWRLWTAHEQVAAHRNEKSNGSAAADTANQSAATDNAQRKPLIVAPMSLLASATDNTGTQSMGVAIPGTCVQRTLRVAALAGHSDNGGNFAFIDFLTSPAGQEIIARTGWAYPLGEFSEQTPASWFLTPREDALELPQQVTTPEGSETAISHW